METAEHTDTAPRRGMIPRVVFCAVYLLFWLAYFVIGKLVFLAYHAPRARGLPVETLLGIVWHGFKMDLATACYLGVLPCLLVALPGRSASKMAVYLIAPYTGLLVLVVAFLTTVDVEVFSDWGHHLDGRLLLYLATPREMLASAGAAPLGLLTAIFLGLVASGLAALYFVLVPRLRTLPPVDLLTSGAVLVVTSPLAIGIMGGTQHIPLNESSVYFSTHDFANQAALNPVWYFADSAYWDSRGKRNPYAFFEPAEAERIVDGALAGRHGAAPALVLNTRRPNILLIVWESFTAKVVQRLGGLPGVTPRFEQLIEDGIFFDHLYATGSRSDVGLTAILSGYPSHGRGPITKTPRKTKGLQFLSRDLERAGYHSAFTYGGELEFAKLKAYLSHGGFHRLVDKYSFPATEWNSKWGAHDHVVLGRQIEALARAPRPFFEVVFTLSSHEPFEVPVAPTFPGTGKESKFLNAHHYTDESIGRFLDEARRQPWWADTLVIIVADHGHDLPVSSAESVRQPPRKYHIPMLWLGGALAQRGLVVSRVGSQIDIARTLLEQLGLDASAYRWSHDLLAPDARPQAFFSFHDGLGWVTSRGLFIWSSGADRSMYEEGLVTEDDRRAGKAYLQTAYEDYLRR